MVPLAEVTERCVFNAMAPRTGENRSLISFNELPRSPQARRHDKIMSALAAAGFSIIGPRGVDSDAQPGSTLY